MLLLLLVLVLVLVLALLVALQVVVVVALLLLLVAGGGDTLYQLVGRGKCRGAPSRTFCFAFFCRTPLWQCV